jgi:hypothetical protein
LRKNSEVQEFRSSEVQEYGYATLREQKYGYATLREQEYGYATLREREFRSSEVQKSRSSGVQKFRSPGVQESRSSGVQKFNSSRINYSVTPATSVTSVFFFLSPIPCSLLPILPELL